MTAILATDSSAVRPAVRPELFDMAKLASLVIQNWSIILTKTRISVLINSLKAFKRFWFSKTFKKRDRGFLVCCSKNCLERRYRFELFFCSSIRSTKRADLLKRQRCDYSAVPDWVIYGLLNNAWLFGRYSDRMLDFKGALLSLPDFECSI